MNFLMCFVRSGGSSIHAKEILRIELEEALQFWDVSSVQLHSAKGAGGKQCGSGLRRAHGS